MSKTVIDSNEEVDTGPSLDIPTTGAMTGPIASEMNPMDDIRNLAGDMLNCIRSSSPSVLSTDSVQRNRQENDFFAWGKMDRIGRSASPSMRSTGSGHLNRSQDFNPWNQRGTVVGVTRTDGASVVSGHDNDRRQLLERRHSDPDMQTIGMTLRSSSRALLECGSANGSLANSVDVRSILDDIAKPINDIDAANALLAVAGNLEDIKDHLSLSDDDDLESLGDDKRYDDDNKSLISRRSTSSKRSNGSKRSHGSVSSRRSVGSYKSIGSRISCSRRIIPKAAKMGSMIPSIPKPYKGRAGAPSIPKAPAFTPKSERPPTTIQIGKSSTEKSKTHDISELDVDDDDTLDPDDDDRSHSFVEMTVYEIDVVEGKAKESENNTTESECFGTSPREPTPTDTSLIDHDDQKNDMSFDKGANISQKEGHLANPALLIHPSSPPPLVDSHDNDFDEKEDQHNDHTETARTSFHLTSPIKADLADGPRIDKKLAYVDYQVTLPDSEDEDDDADNDDDHDEEVAALTPKAEPIDEACYPVRIHKDKSKFRSPGILHISGRLQHQHDDDDDDEVGALTPNATTNEESKHSVIFLANRKKSRSSGIVNSNRRLSDDKEDDEDDEGVPLGTPNGTAIKQSKHSVTSSGTKKKYRSPVNLSSNGRASEMPQEGMSGQPTNHHTERKRFLKENKIKTKQEVLEHRRASIRTASSIREPQEFRLLGQQSKVKSGVQREQRRSHQPYPYSAQDSSVASAQGLRGQTVPNQLSRSSQSGVHQDQRTNKVKQTRRSSIGYFSHSSPDDHSPHLSKELEHQLLKRSTMRDPNARFTGHGVLSHDRGPHQANSQRQQNIINSAQPYILQHKSEEIEDSIRSTRSRESLRSADTAMSSRCHGDTRGRELRQTRPMRLEGSDHQRPRQAGSTVGSNLGPYTGKPGNRHDTYLQQMAQPSDSRRAMKCVAQQQDEQLRLLNLKRGMRPMLAELRQRSQSRLNADDEEGNFRMGPRSSSGTFSYNGTPPENAKYKNGIPMIIAFDVRQSGRSVSPYEMKDDKEMDLNEMTAKLNYDYRDPGLPGLPVGPQHVNSASFLQHTQSLSRNDKISISAYDANARHEAPRRRPQPHITSRQFGR